MFGRRPSQSILQRKTTYDLSLAGVGRSDTQKLLLLHLFLFLGFRSMSSAAPVREGP